MNSLHEASSNPEAFVTGGTSEEQGYQAFYLIHDETGELMPTTIVAVHDVRTDRLFLAGVFSRGISICKAT
ncbi:hypothetical protein N7532_005520 [Penicillium argentinense]|uniref:Uncharacterized protein n=1 Tax=Penicillium argentinense TaxID=1131581 RepID=A0A9W9K9X4_9EURO|nr:uncharacterized protein N7532_005520 [Penicillium argentinense]KAJ5098519.1 hypothetical protein N7532_005520 [Penicillium argentinense]